MAAIVCIYSVQELIIYVQVKYDQDLFYLIIVKHT